MARPLLWKTLKPNTQVVLAWSSMKLIEAYIPAEALYEVQDVLAECGIDELVASEVAVEVGYERQRLGSERAKFVPQLKLEMAVADDQAQNAANQIFKTADKGQGKRRIQILIGRLEQVVRIEAGQRNFAAPQPA